MKSDTRKYYLGDIIYKSINDFVYFFIPLIIIGSIIGLSPFKIVVLVSEMIALAFIGEALQLFIYDKVEVVLSQKGAFLSVIIICGLFLAYGLPLLGHTINFNPILFNIYVMGVILSLGAAAFAFLWRFKRYREMAKSILNKDNLFVIDNLKADLKFKNVKIDEKEMSKADLNTKKYNSKHGYEYLNSLFFLRFRKIIIKPIVYRVVFVGAVFIIGMCLTIFIPNKSGDIVNTIKKSAPMLVFIMYSMSTGERTCKAMFFNCDIVMLRYSYYRESSVILANFTSRFKRIVILNLIPALTLCIAIACIIVASGYPLELISMIPIFLSICCLACFFSIHHLFMYYVLQPYTEALTVKSPLFKVVNFIVYVISYMCLNAKTTSFYFTAGVIITTVIYMVVALLLTYRVAPRTFRLK